MTSVQREWPHPWTNYFFREDFVDSSFYGIKTVQLLEFKLGHPDTLP